MFKKFVFIAFLAICLMSFAQGANAASLSAGPLQISYDGDGPVFSESNVEPGETYSKDITVTNNGTVSHSFALATTNISGDLAGHLFLEPKVAGTAAWKTSIYDLGNLAEESKTVVDSIAPGETVVVSLSASMDETSGDEYQNTNVSFDLIFGTEEAEPPATRVSGARLFAALAPAVGSATPTPSPSPSPSISPSPEVKGAQAESGSHGLKWQFLLIVPVVGILAIAALPATIEAAILVPAASGAAAAFLAQNYSGTLKPWIFWLILVVEIIFFFVIKYRRYLRRLALEAVKDVEAETKKLERKIKKDLKIK